MAFGSGDSEETFSSSACKGSSLFLLSARFQSVWSLFGGGTVGDTIIYRHRTIGTRNRASRRAVAYPEGLVLSLCPIVGYKLSLLDRARGPKCSATTAVRQFPPT